MLGLIDTHAHLTDKRFNIDEIITQMPQDNLKAIVTVGYDAKSSFLGADIANKNKNIFYAVGIHPSETKSAKAEDYKKFLEHSKNEKCVAIGEIGLDYHYPDTDKKKQYDELMIQLDLVKNANLPAIFHVRDSDGDMFEIIKNNLDKLPKRGVMHCFSGSLEMAKIYIDMGFYLSFSGVVTYKNAKKMPDIVKAIPLDRLVVETDCPYLPPEPFRGQTNYPKYVAKTAEKIADILNMDIEKVHEQTTINACKMFDKIKLV